MLRRFFSKYKVEILEAYMAAAVCFVCLSGLNMGWIGTTIVIGFTNTYLVGPVKKALKFGNRSDEDILKVNHIILVENVARAFIICAILVGIYYLIYKHLFHIGIEPITFGMLYKLLDIALSKLIVYAKLKSV